MSDYELYMLMVGTACFVLSLVAGNQRGMVWIAAICCDLIVSTWYWRAGLPFADAVTGTLDFSVCAAIYCFGRHQWELHIWLLFQLSMLASIADAGSVLFAGAGIDHDAYSAVLELINYLAFILIGGVSSYALAGRRNIGLYRPWRWLRPAGFPLLAEKRRTQG